MLKGFRHIFKLDPAKELEDDALEKICHSGTDGIIVGGTDGITYDNTYDLVRRIRSYQIPVFQEISQQEAIVRHVDGYLIPLVLNATNPRWIFQAHQEAIKAYGSLIPWQDCQVEGYIILNQSSKVAQLTEAYTNLSEEDVIAYAQLADLLLKLPYVYIEYSGTYGDPQLLSKIKSQLQHASLIYGGGIDCSSRAEEMAGIADTIIVGNVIYEDLPKALETVQVLHSK